ncbi:MAG: hypothetical protein DMF69_02750 [Acidobacteria bacterium]|nr:MAG: hypothetical protein DMF69_02750 [Acidobacteriota bacterium]
MRQSLQPVLVPAVLSVVFVPETAAAPLLGMKTRPCLCAASTVVPYRIKSVNNKPTVRDIDAVLLLKVLERMLVAVRIDVLESEGCQTPAL